MTTDRDGDIPAEQDFGEMLERAMNQLGMSYGEAAERFHTAPNVVRMWVSGKARPTPRLQENVMHILKAELARDSVGTAVADAIQFT